MSNHAPTLPMLNVSVAPASGSVAVAFRDALSILQLPDEPLLAPAPRAPSRGRLGAPAHNPAPPPPVQLGPSPALIAAANFHARLAGGPIVERAEAPRGRFGAAVANSLAASARASPVQTQSIVNNTLPGPLSFAVGAGAGAELAQLTSQLAGASSGGAASAADSRRAAPWTPHAPSLPRLGGGGLFSAAVAAAVGGGGAAAATGTAPMPAPQSSSSSAALPAISSSSSTPSALLPTAAIARRASSHALQPRGYSAAVFATERAAAAVSGTSVNTALSATPLAASPHHGPVRG